MRGQGAERFLGVVSAEPCGDGACQVRITAAREIVGFESLIAHNCLAEVVSLESSQGFRFGGRCVDDGGTDRAARLSNERGRPQYPPAERLAGRRGESDAQFPRERPPSRAIQMAAPVTSAGSRAIDPSNRWNLAGLLGVIARSDSLDSDLPKPGHAGRQRREKYMTSTELTEWLKRPAVQFA